MTEGGLPKAIGWYLSTPIAR